MSEYEAKQLIESDPELKAELMKMRQLPKEFKLTELGNAERLSAKFGNDIRFCHEWGKWLIWTGTHWQIDLTGEIERMAKETVRGIYSEAFLQKDEEKRAALAKFAAKSETSRAINAMVTLARSEPGIPILSDEFDSNIWLLNCKNGTLDLRTGKLKPHDRNDCITKFVPVEYDPCADFVEWAKFLNRTMDGDQELISFLQRAVGYSLTGSTKEQCLFILHGTGANGKTTFLETIAELLSGYAQKTPTDTLMMKDTSGVPNDLARLKGSRFVVASEAEEGKRLAESLIKQLTGSEKIAARFLRAEFFEFSPMFKIWIGTNHKPLIRGSDMAIWRRIRLIPFSITIPEPERDKELPSKLRKELSGILNWAVMGCLEWQRNGLGEPEEVRTATEGYRNEMDAIGRFIQDSCITGTEKSIKSSDLYKGYREWCRENNEFELTQTKFSLRLEERGFTKQKTRLGIFWNNISLLDEGL